MLNPTISQREQTESFTLRNSKAEKEVPLELNVTCVYLCAAFYHMRNVMVYFRW